MANTYGTKSTNYPRHRCLSCTCISVAIGQFIVELTVREMSSHYQHYVSCYEHEMYHLCQYEYDTFSANCKHNNINIDALVQTAATVEYVQGGPKRLFLRDDNFVTFTGKKVFDMYKVSKLCRKNV